MGSGLILLVIVGAWPAVLVPMALRSHDASNALGTVDKFHDAMRVLSRRDGVARAAQQGGRPPVGGHQRGHSTEDASLVDASRYADRSTRRAPDRAAADHAGSYTATAGPAVPGAASADHLIAAHRSAAHPTAGHPTVDHHVDCDQDVDDRRTGPTPAARRRRALAVLTGAVLVTLVGALVGPSWLLVPHLVADVLLGGYVVWLRRQVLARQALVRQERRAEEHAPVEDAAPVTSVLVVRPGHVAGIPDRMPSRALVDSRHVVVPAARSEAVPVTPAVEVGVAPARGAQGEPWQPVPVPVPMYVTAPTAPPRPAPTRTHALAYDGRTPYDAEPSELDVVLERRRAVGD